MSLIDPVKSFLQKRRNRKASALPDGPSDIVDLFQRGFVSVKGVGQSITDITAEIASRVNVPLKVAVPHGTYFVSAGNHQNMVTRYRRNLELDAFAVERMRFPATCINASLPIPGEKDRFNGVSRVPQNVRRFIEAAEGEVPMVIQAGVWALTDHLSRAQMQGVLRRRVTSNYGSGRAPRADAGPAISDAEIDRAQAILESLRIKNSI